MSSVNKAISIFIFSLIPAVCFLIMFEKFTQESKLYLFTSQFQHYLWHHVKYIIQLLKLVNIKNLIIRRD